jgi:hypothetical protein
MRLIGGNAVETAAAHSVLILRSPPQAGVSKDGRGEKLSSANVRKKGWDRQTR